MSKEKLKKEIDLNLVYKNAFVLAKHSYQTAYNYLMEVIDNLKEKT